MSWIQDLYTTYENCQSIIGNGDDTNEVPLLPICHTTQKAQIEICIDGNGNFLRSAVIPRDDSRTIIPCTESSGGRTSGVCPHPLCDKLQYVAADYKEMGGSKEACFSLYSEQLKKWCESEYSTKKLMAVFTYIQKGCVIHDLINSQTLIVGPDQKLLKEWPKQKDQPVPEIFKVCKSQEEAFIRWIVEVPNDECRELWRDEKLWESWIAFYSSIKTKKGLCYVTGVEKYLADQHPAKIRNDGDKAKLISSNDSSGFTYRGRFETSDQAADVGFEISQKAHFALRWLISRQGFTNGDLAIVAWAISGVKVPNPVDDWTFISGIDELVSDHPEEADTAQKVALQFKKRLAGYGVALGQTTDVVVMGVDSATPGRLSIIYYQKLKGADFLKRIDQWHETCAWLHTYHTTEIIDPKTGKSTRVTLPFIGAPAPKDIVGAAYGPRVDEKLTSATIKRILPCIVDAVPIPYDLMESTVRRACNRTGKDKWEWEKTLSIACSLYKKYETKEKYEMALDENRKTRDYLYGRLLALAESLEKWALDDAHENRETNASRLMQRFAEHPYSTWRTIELSLAPYKARLGGKAFKRLRLMDDVIGQFNPDDFTSDKRLSGEFLLGYHCQREDLRNLSKSSKEETETIVGSELQQ